MSWPNVATIFIFVAGAVTAAAMHHEELGLCLAGAAAGFVHFGGGGRAQIPKVEP